jgi:bifunctional DNA-binding transcriptional regulator/antitoxin component of YhaV-PrlF toxin-antitoxin module
MPAVIPLFTPATPPAPSSLTRPGPGPTAARRGLPLPGVPSARAADAPVYRMATLDCHGRIADRTILRSLGWRAGHRLTIAEGAGRLTVATDPDGEVQVTTQGHLRIPAALRHRCALCTGDRVLLVADPNRSHLAIYPPATLDTALTQQPSTPHSGEPE